MGSGDARASGEFRAVVVMELGDWAWGVAVDLLEGAGRVAVLAGEDRPFARDEQCYLATVVVSIALSLSSAVCPRSCVGTPTLAVLSSERSGVGTAGNVMQDNRPTRRNRNIAIF